MSSRDDSNRPRLRDVSQPEGSERPAPRSRFSDVDPADIDRYLSGRPSRSQEQAARPKPSLSTTASQLEQLQRQVAGGGASRRRRSTTASPANEQLSDTTTARPSAASMAARSTFRTNRRSSYMREDPYVDDLDEMPLDVADPVPSERTSNRRAAPVYDEPSDPTWGDDDAWADDDGGSESAPQRQSPRRQQRPRASIQRPTIHRPTVPRVISGADVLNDAPALVFIALSTLGLAAMAILVANRISDVDATFPTHVSASGMFERFASRETIWQLPLLATMMTLMNIGAAWFVSPLDRFASRFLLATSVVVQFVAWVAVLRILY